MARFYTNENIALQVVVELRRLGHDVPTSWEAGKANAAIAAIPEPADQLVLVKAARLTLDSETRHANGVRKLFSRCGRHGLSAPSLPNDHPRKVRTPALRAT